VIHFGFRAEGTKKDSARLMDVLTLILPRRSFYGKRSIE